MSSINKSFQRGAGVILQYFQMALSIIIQLVYTPILLRILGSAEYGIYNTASSIISYLSLLSLGFGASYIRFYSIYKKDNDEENIKKLNGLYLLVFCAIGITALIIGLALSSNAYIFYNDTYSSREVEIAGTLMIFLTINLAISFPASVFTSYVTSQERFVFQKIVNMGKTILSPAVSVIVLYLGYGSVGMVIVTTCISLFIDVVNITYCLTKLRMKISFKNLDFRLLKSIFVFSIFIAINQIIDQINWQTDKMVLGKVVNSTSVAIYAVGSSINGMFTSFSTAVSSVFAPKVNMIVSRNGSDMDVQLNRIFVSIGRLQWFILVLVLSGFVFFGKYFIFIWAGSEYENSYWVALLLMLPATIPLIQNVGIEIQIAKNKHQFRSIVYLIMAILNIIISVWLSAMWGEIGAAIGTTISLLVANGLIMNVYYQKKIGINILKFWKSIISTIPSFVIPAIMGVYILLFYSFHSIWDFSILIIIYLLIYAFSVYILGMNDGEKMLAKGIIKRIMR